MTHAKTRRREGEKVSHNETMKDWVRGAQRHSIAPLRLRREGDLHIASLFHCVKNSSVFASSRLRVSILPEQANA
jgi:hypothetical protein